MPAEPRPEIQAIAFDVNGTLVEIWTDEHLEQIFRSIGHFLTYQGVNLRRHQVRDRYFAILKQQQDASAEEYPEFDAEAVWRQLVEENASDFTRALPPEKLTQLPLFLAEMYRGISRRTLKLYPHVRHMLDTLRGRMPLALVTDAQSAYARGELHKVGILGYFDPIVVSGDHGYRKPDARLFRTAIDAMGISAANTLYVGNDMHRDIHGAREAGMQTMMFDSNQGNKHYRGTVPDHRITDFRQLLALLGL